MLLLISGLSWGQKSLQTPYQLKMDSISLSKLDLNYRPIISTKKDGIVFNKLKFNLATRVNIVDLSQFNFDIRNLDGIMYESDLEDYMGIFKYDFRVKYYMTSRVKFFTRVIMVGTQYRENQYLTGVFIKF